MAKIAINGMGRIGRAVFKIMNEKPGLEIVALNDLTPVDQLVYLLKYDSIYGRYEKEVRGEEDTVFVADRDSKSLPKKTRRSFRGRGLVSILLLNPPGGLRIRKVWRNIWQPVQRKYCSRRRPRLRVFRQSCMG